MSDTPGDACALISDAIAMVDAFCSIAMFDGSDAIAMVDRSDPLRWSTGSDVSAMVGGS